MTNQPLHVNSIKKMLAEQEKNLADISQSIKDLQKQIEEKSADEEISKLMMSKLIETLEDEYGITYNHIEATQSNNPILSKEYTYKIIDNATEARGIQARAIVQKYKDIGISTHNRMIDGHIKELISDGLVYQTNPDNIRGRLYKTK